MWKRRPRFGNKKPRILKTGVGKYGLENSILNATEAVGKVRFKILTNHLETMENCKAEIVIWKISADSKKKTMDSETKNATLKTEKVNLESAANAPSGTVIWKLQRSIR